MSLAHESSNPFFFLVESSRIFPVIGIVFLLFFRLIGFFLGTWRTRIYSSSSSTAAELVSAFVAAHP
jgi:hypothetical protein